MPTNPIEKPQKAYSINNGVNPEIKKREYERQKNDGKSNEEQSKFKKMYDVEKKKIEDREGEER